MSPKKLGSTLRILHACQELRRLQEPDLAQVALVCGYYDQAHFSNDFRETCGLTPTEFRHRSDISFFQPDW